MSHTREMSLLVNLHVSPNCPKFQPWTEPLDQSPHPPAPHLQTTWVYAQQGWQHAWGAAAQAARGLLALRPWL